MQQIPYNKGELIKYLDNLNLEKEVDDYFLQNRDDIGLIDVDNYKNMFKDLNKKVGILSRRKKRMGLGFEFNKEKKW